MILSTHYYVLSLGDKSGELYEAFRDALIGVENQGFPATLPISAPAPSRLELMRKVDESFDFYDSRERLGLVVVGEAALQSAFDSVTTHEAAIVGRVRRAHSGARPSDLGQVVWPVVKDLISGTHERALRDLDQALRAGRLVSGLEAVVVAATAGHRGTLLVEDEFRVRGSLAVAPQPSGISEDVDVRGTHDDAVDAVIERVLENGGNVVFLREGSLADRGRIVLLLDETRGP